MVAGVPGAWALGVCRRKGMRWRDVFERRAICLLHASAPEYASGHPAVVRRCNRPCVFPFDLPIDVQKVSVFLFDVESVLE